MESFEKEKKKSKAPPRLPARLLPSITERLTKQRIEWIETVKVNEMFGRMDDHSKTALQNA